MKNTQVKVGDVFAGKLGSENIPWEQIIKHNVFFPQNDVNLNTILNFNLFKLKKITGIFNPKLFLIFETFSKKMTTTYCVGAGIKVEQQTKNYMKKNLEQKKLVKFLKTIVVLATDLNHKFLISEDLENF